MHGHAGPIEGLSTVLAGLEFPATGAKVNLSDPVVWQLDATTIFASPLIGILNNTILTGVLKSIGACVTNREVHIFRLRGLTSRAHTLISFKFWKFLAGINPVPSELFNFHFGFAKAAGDYLHKVIMPCLNKFCNSYSQLKFATED